MPKNRCSNKFISQKMVKCSGDDDQRCAEALSIGVGHFENLTNYCCLEEEKVTKNYVIISLAAWPPSAHPW